ncbi:MAG: hypothetical protein R2748_22550 [Bryobacterales bacterium]
MDVTQEALLKVHRNWAMRDPIGRWAPGSCHFAQHGDRLPAEAQISEARSAERAGCFAASWTGGAGVKGQIQEQVWQAIAQLPEQQREVLVLPGLTWLLVQRNR